MSDKWWRAPVAVWIVLVVGGAISGNQILLGMASGLAVGVMLARPRWEP